VKVAIITIKLLEESAEKSIKDLEKELLNWFKENTFLIPWAQDIKNVKVKENSETQAFHYDIS